MAKRLKLMGEEASGKGNEITTNENELELESKYFKTQSSKIGVVVRVNKLHILNFFVFKFYLYIINGFF
jgi:hypothetical protein